jgi:hypothetical protein
MAKSVKKLPPFQIPKAEEVQAFMNLCKPDWPTAFLQYYSQRWMDHYMANGFVVGRVKMKDWKSCVRGQWLQLKFREDKERLEADLKSWQHKVLLDEKRRKSAGLFAVVEGAGPTPFDRYLESMDEIFHAWQVGNASDGQLRAAAESLRKNNFLLLPKSQIEQIKADQGNNADLGKLLAVRQFFANLKQRGMTVSAFIRSKTGSPEQKTA